MSKRTAFLFVYLVFLIVSSAFFVWFIKTQSFSARDKPSAIETYIARHVRDLAIPTEAKKLKNPLSPTPLDIAEGRDHYADHCAICHANNGSGVTMYGKTMYPRPPDMRQKDTQEMSDGELYYTIKNGVRLSGMPAFGDPGDDDVDSWKLVAFIRHLPQLTPAEETEMQHLNPKSPDEIQEEKEEEDFLKGDAKSARPATTMHHH